MSDLGGRLLAFVPTRRAAIVLFVVALAVYWLQALGWPMAKGRDTWDYLVYYLQFLDGDPPLSQVQLFRTPLTPLVVGLPMAIGGSALLEIVFGVLFAVGVVAWSATALVFGRVPALASAVLLLVYPAWATLYHQASSDAVFATGLALWALVLARTLRWPSTWGFVALGLGIAILVLIRPANQVLLPAVLVPLLAAAPWRRRLTWVAACLAAAVLPLAGWAVHNGIRYDDATVARGGRAWVPFLKVWLDDRTVAPENGAQSRRLADLIERHVLTEEPFASLHVPLDAYLANGSNYETVRLIALSDRYLGRDDDYEAIFGSAIEAIRAHPRTYFRGVADVFWQFLMQAPIREGVAPRAQTEPAPPPATYTRDGVVLPNPAATVLVPAVPYGFVWCASDYLDSCTLDDPSVVWKDAKTQRRYREVVSQVRAWDAELPERSGRQWVTEILDRITPRFPRPPLWIAVGVVALALATAARLADDPRLVGRRGRRARNPRRLAGRRARVRPPPLPALHRDRPRRARRRPRTGPALVRLMRAAAVRFGPVFALTLLGALLRFPTLDRQSFWLDELVTASLLDRGLGDVLGEIPRTEATPYLYYVVAWLWSSVFGLGEVGLRSLSALAGTATIPVAYVAGGVLVSRRAGIVAAALVATSPFLVWYSQEARSYALFALLGATSVLAFGLALRASVAGWRGVA